MPRSAPALLLVVERSLPWGSILPLPLLLFEGFPLTVVTPVALFGVSATAALPAAAASRTPGLTEAANHTSLACIREDVWTQTEE